MKKSIAVLAGDGIGLEIIEQTIKVLNKVAEKFGHTFTFNEGLIGATAIEETGTALPPETLELCAHSHAILFGCIGHPKYDKDPSAKVRPEDGLLKLREELDLYANIHPIKSYDLLLSSSPLKKSVIEDVDFVVYRELSSGIYFGKPSRISEHGNSAVDTSRYTKEEISRVAKLAFDYAKTTKGKVTLVDKANILATSKLWREVVTEFAKKYKSVELECMYVDKAAMKIIQEPQHFDVILTENLYGDILTDEASVITGSLGMLPSASLGTKISLFAPVHGACQELAGQDRANPFAGILSGAMLLEYSFGLSAESAAIERSIEKAMNTGMMTADIKTKGKPCSEVGDFVADQIWK